MVCRWAGCVLHRHIVNRDDDAQSRSVSSPFQVADPAHPASLSAGAHGVTLGVRGIVIDGAGHVFLVKHSYNAGWYLPGGGVEVGKTLATALARELREEGNIRLTDPPHLFAMYLTGANSRRDHVALYVVRSFHQSEPPLLNGEIVAHGFFLPDSLPDDTTLSTRARIAEVLERRPSCRDLVSCLPRHAALPAVVESRGNRRLLHRQGQRRAETGLALLRDRAGRRSAASLLTKDEARARRCWAPSASRRRGPSRRRRRAWCEGPCRAGAMRVEVNHASTNPSLRVEIATIMAAKLRECSPI